MAVNYIIIHVVGRPENTVGIELTFDLMDLTSLSQWQSLNIAEGIFLILSDAQ